MSIFLLSFADRLNKLFFSYPRIYAGFIGFFFREAVKLSELFNKFKF